MGVWMQTIWNENHFIHLKYNLIKKKGLKAHAWAREEIGGLGLELVKMGSEIVKKLCQFPSPFC